jgi:tetratricopeptide (TPR) repeat protein
VKLMRLSHIEAALEGFDLVLKDYPTDVLVLNNYGWALNRIGRYEDASRTAQKALKIRADSVEALIVRAKAEIGLKQMQEADTSLAEALKLAPENPACHLALGELRTTQTKYQEALDAYDNALLYKADPADVWVGKGFTLIELGRAQEAMELHARCVEADCWNANYWRLGTRAAAALGNWEHVVQLARDGQRLCRNDSNLYADEALAWLELGKPKEAERPMAFALQLVPMNIYALNTRGLVHWRKGETEQAREKFQEALRIQPGFDLAIRNIKALNDALGMGGADCVKP